MLRKYELQCLARPAIILVAALFLGLAWRQRGGANWIDADYTTLYRMAWALPFALVMTAYAEWRGVSWRFMAPVLFLAAWVMLLNGHAEHMDMGNRPTNDNMVHGIPLSGELVTFWLPNYGPGDPMWWRAGIDYIGMAVVATLRGAILGLPFLAIERRAVWIMAAAGPVVSLGYMIGWRRIPGTDAIPDILAALSPEMATPYAVGEFITGVVYALAAFTVIELAAARHGYAQNSSAQLRGVA